MSKLHNNQNLKEIEIEEILSYKIKELNFSIRTINCLRSKKVLCVSDLVKYSESQLLSIRNFGFKCLSEVINELKKLGLELNMSFDNLNNIKNRKKFRLKPYYSIDKYLENKVIPNSLEEELKNVTSIIKDNRDKQIIMKYLGWDGEGKKTLESVAQDYEITRERVRQIYTKFKERLQTLKEIKNSEYPKLDAALNYVADHVPLRLDQIESELIEKGITEKKFKTGGLETAANLLGKNCEFSTVKINNKKIVISCNDQEIPKIVINLTKKNMTKKGITNLSDITEQVNETTKKNFSENNIKSIVSAYKDFRWLDKSSGWFWFKSLPRNRLLNVIKKIISVSDSISISELRAGISRFHRLSFAPTRRVLLELCKQIKWCSVNGDVIKLCAPLKWEQTIKGTTEWAFISLLKEYGPVMQREELEKECVNIGMNLNTFYQYLSFSPILCKYAPGVYGLRGAKIPPGLVESLIPKKKEAVTLDYGWTPYGSIWIIRKLNKSAMQSGVIGIPSAMKKHLQGKFNCKTAEGDQIGTFTIKDCSGWSLGSFFKRRGGEEGDFILLIFNIKKKEMKIRIGDEDILNERVKDI